MFFPFQGDPYRPPARRFLRAEYLASHGERPRRFDDYWVRSARRYLLGQQRSPRAAAASQKRYPAIHQAHQIYADGGFRKFVMEAWFLTGEPFDEIAQRCDLPARVVDAYHALFFYVQHLLTATDYIFNIAISTRVHWQLTENDLDLVMKLHGYYGTRSLKDLLDYLEDPPTLPAMLSDLDDMDVHALDRLEHRLNTAIIVALRVLPEEGLRERLTRTCSHLSFDLMEAPDQNQRVKAALQIWTILYGRGRPLPFHEEPSRTGPSETFSVPPLVASQGEVDAAEVLGEPRRAASRSIARRRHKRGRRAQGHVPSRTRPDYLSHGTVQAEAEVVVFLGSKDLQVEALQLPSWKR
jgi:hypothetical protein